VTTRRTNAPCEVPWAASARRSPSCLTVCSSPPARRAVRTHWRDLGCGARQRSSTRRRRVHHQPPSVADGRGTGQAVKREWLHRVDLRARAELGFWVGSAGLEPATGGLLMCRRRVKTEGQFSAGVDMSEPSPFRLVGPESTGAVRSGRTSIRSGRGRPGDNDRIARGIASGACLPTSSAQDGDDLSTCALTGRRGERTVRRGLPGAVPAGRLRAGLASHQWFGPVVAGGMHSGNDGNCGQGT
jgi:hypothetical protein